MLRNKITSQKWAREGWSVITGLSFKKDRAARANSRFSLLSPIRPGHGVHFLCRGKPNTKDAHTHRLHIFDGFDQEMIWVLDIKIEGDSMEQDSLTLDDGISELFILLYQQRDK